VQCTDRDAVWLGVTTPLQLASHCCNTHLTDHGLHKSKLDLSNKQQLVQEHTVKALGAVVSVLPSWTPRTRVHAPTADVTLKSALNVSTELPAVHSSTLQSDALPSKVLVLNTPGVVGLHCNSHTKVTQKSSADAAQLVCIICCAIPSKVLVLNTPGVVGLHCSHTVTRRAVQMQLAWFASYVVPCHQRCWC
jgi:hypothetical protein